MVMGRGLVRVRLGRVMGRVHIRGEVWYGDE